MRMPWSVTLISAPRSKSAANRAMSSSSWRYFAGRMSSAGMSPRRPRGGVRLPVVRNPGRGSARYGARQRLWRRFRHQAAAAVPAHADGRVMAAVPQIHGRAAGQAHVQQESRSAALIGAKMASSAAQAASACISWAPVRYSAMISSTDKPFATRLPPAKRRCACRDCKPCRPGWRDRSNSI